MTRSAARSAEIRVMDAIERAMQAIGELPETAQARVRRWVAEEYPPPPELRLTWDEQGRAGIELKGQPAKDGATHE